LPGSRWKFGRSLYGGVADCGSSKRYFRPAS
jgi:hypothetical protein